MTFCKLLTAAVAALFVTGCQSLGMSGQTIAYNEAVADSTNQFFLLNVLRARDRFPIYYTRTTGNNSAQGVSPSVTFSLSDQHLTPGMTIGASGSNTVALANLDDQKSMRGVLTPVPLTLLESYLDQGWPREVLLMMFVKRIEIDADLARDLVKAFNTRCAQGLGDKPLPTDQAANLDYCGGTLPNVWNPTTQSYKVAGSPSAKVTACLAGPPVKGPGPDAVFDNYPADMLRLHCFQAMLRVLIGLGLAPSSGAKFTVVVPQLPEPRADDLRGLGDAITAKLSIARRDDGGYAVCTKSANSGFTLTTALTGKDDLCTQIVTACRRYPNAQGHDICAQIARSPVAREYSRSLTPETPEHRQSAGSTNSEMRTNAESVQATVAAGVDEVAGQPTVTEPAIAPGGGAASLLGAATPADCAQQAVCVPWKTDFCKQHKGDPLCASPTFQITTRALDTMIYYLGETLRDKTTDDTDDKTTDVAVWVTGPDPLRFNRVTLFEAATDGVSGRGLVSVRYGGESWGIPACSDTTGVTCGRSLQVFSLLNQIWGLQKEAAETPSIPVVSVINSH